MKSIRDIPFVQNFYWKGKRYKQLIRPRKPPGKFVIVCVESDNGNSDWFNMPSGRMVKQILRCPK